MKRKIVISGEYGSGLGSAWGHMPEAMMYGLIESPVLIQAVKERWQWPKVLSALIEAGFDQHYIEEMQNCDYGWFPRGKPMVIEVTAPYQLLEYDGMEFVVEHSSGYWRS